MMTIKDMKESIESISTEDLMKAMSKQWEGIEEILKEVDNFMIGIETKDFFLSYKGSKYNLFNSEAHEEKEVLSMLHLMDIAYAQNVTIAGLLATSYTHWIKEKEEKMMETISSWIWDEFHLHYVVVDLLWKEHEKWSSIIGQTKEFNL